MIKKVLFKLEGFSKDLATNYTPYTNVIGLARSVLALGTLLTLVINPTHYFINKSIEGIYYNPLLNLEEFPVNKFNFFLVFGVENIYLMKWLAIVILVIVVSGYFIKVSSILHWWVAISFMLSSSLLDGGDQIATILSFLLIPICLTDNRKNHWHKGKKVIFPKNLIAILFVWLIRLQVAIIYLNASTGKFNTTEWANGTALYYWLNHSVFGISDFYRPILNTILSNEYFQPILTYGVLILELCLFLSLTASIKYRKRILPLAISFHLFIILFHGIFSFFFSITAALIIFLYPTYQNINFKLWKNIK